jgi:hypothetical protein
VKTSLASVVRSHGHLTRTSVLSAVGFSRYDIEQALRHGEIVRVCQGWVATLDASQTSILAATSRAKLAGTTSLASRGIWDATDSRIHLQHAPNAHPPIIAPATPLQSFAPPKFPAGEVIRHWSKERHVLAAEPPWRTSVIDALLLTAHTATFEHLVASIDSAIYLKLLSRAALPTLRGLLPRWARPAIELADPRAESGLESIARLRLAPLARTIEPQFVVPGIGRGGGAGRVDLLLDNWLVIELDGDEFHDPAIDRGRNAILVGQGFRQHRFGYAQVIFDARGMERVVRELLAYPPTENRRRFAIYPAGFSSAADHPRQFSS